MKNIKIMILATNLMPSYINATPGVDKMNLEIMPTPLDLMTFTGRSRDERSILMNDALTKNTYIANCKQYSLESGIPNIIIVNPYTAKNEADVLLKVFPDAFLVSISTVDSVLVDMLPFIHRVFHFEKKENETQLTTIEFVEWLKRNRDKILDPQQKYDVEENKTTIAISKIIFDNLKKEHQKKIAADGAAKIIKELQAPQKSLFQKILSKIFR